MLPSLESTLHLVFLRASGSGAAAVLICSWILVLKPNRFFKNLHSHVYHPYSVLVVLKRIVSATRW